MYRKRLDLYEELESLRGSRILTYVTSDRRNLETQIGKDALPVLSHHLDAIRQAGKISLFLYTRGGDTLTSWSIANLVRQFCDEFEVIVPSVAHSGGTLICLGADSIVMTKQATLGPIDPSVTTQLNPQIPGAPPDARVPVSVEAINSYLEFAKDQVGERADMAQIVADLAKQIHPLVLGQAYRARGQIRMLAKKLIGRQIRDDEHVERVLSFLCSESGSHDYTIDRDEAREDLGMKVTKPDDNQYAIVKDIFADISSELELTAPYNPSVALGSGDSASYNLRRGLVESRPGGCHAFVSKGNLIKQQVEVQPGVIQEALQDKRTFEGWEKVEDPERKIE